MTSSQLDVRRGSQTPRVSSYPSYALSDGQDVIDFARTAGLVLDEWQQYVLRHGLGMTLDGSWSANKVSVWVPRQNGKGAIIEALELYWLFVMGEELVVHSAHEHRTSQKAYQRLERLIRRAPALARRVRTFRQANGEQQVEFYSGQLLQYVTRSGTAIRGFSTARLVLDESQELTSDQMAAMMPTVSAMSNWQAWFFGTPPRKQDAWCYGLKSDGEAGVPRLAHFDWGAGLDPTDPADRARVHDRELWYATNPALNIRIFEATVEDEARPSGLGEKFIHERLGAWMPSLLDSGLVDLEVWGRWLDAGSAATGQVSLALDSHPDRMWSAIGMTGRRPDGLRHWQVLEHRPGMSWLLARAIELDGELLNVGWSVDPNSPAGSLIADMEKAGLTVHQVTGREMAQACTSMLNAAADGSGRHCGELDAALTQSWRDARTVASGDSERFGRKKSSGDITPLMVVTLSDHGFRVHGETETSPWALYA